MERKAIDNVKIFLDASCRAHAGESVLVIVASEGLMAHAPAIVEAALELGLVPCVMDVRPFTGSAQYKQGYIHEPIRAAMKAADIVISTTPMVPGGERADYSRYMGDPDAHDNSLTSERKWMYLQCGGIEDWNITKEEVIAMRERTLWLLKRLRSATKGHVTSGLGTELTFGLGPGASCTPILGIAPLYAEVAVVPAPQSTSGLFVIDGPTQQGVRRANELDREPLRITVKSGRAVNMTGDPVQLQRLKTFIASGDPPADSIDEVGILTTRFIENDKYHWSDGTHHHDRVHIALGNNARRDKVVHGPAHMDGEVSKPTISIDGQAIVRDGVFLDEVMRDTGEVKDG